MYASLVLFTLHAPVDPKSPLVLLFGSQDMARQAARIFVHWLFWPFVAVLAITVIQALVEYRTKTRA
jgi:alkanesulfonate monooxygenase SsuD/methylene tetrahydromethanopterin reductase-like flavin-dependent oxidoreductase (luciferase family)